MKGYCELHTLIHEIGHTLGLKHAEIKNGIDIMDPKYNGKVTLSDYDILRIRKKYGIRMFSGWSLYQRLKAFLRNKKREYRTVKNIGMSLCVMQKGGKNSSCCWLYKMTDVPPDTC